MDFNIYEILDESAGENPADLPDDCIVESGLSSGELRQAILDRFRQETQTEDVYFLNLTLGQFGLEFEPDLIETDEGRASILTDIENLLYDTEDEDIVGTTWDFHNEVIYIGSDE